MKTLILALGLLPCCFSSYSQVPPDEKKQIEEMIGLYFDGWATGDTVKLGTAMHSSCRLKNYRDGKFTEYTRNQYLALNKPRPRPQNLQTRIVAIDVTNNMGSAKAEIITERDVFTDYFNLMKTTEGWVIADKVSTRTPREQPKQ